MPPGCSAEDIMLDPTRVLCTGLIAGVLCSGAALLPAFAAAPILSESDDRAIKEAIAYCKDQVKIKKIRFPASRAYLRDCVTETIRNNSAKR